MPSARLRLLSALSVAGLMLGVCGACGSGGDDGEPVRLGFVNGANAEFHSCLLKSVTREAKEAGALLFTANSQQDPAAELANIEDMISRRVDALIVQTVDVNGLKVLAAQLDGADVKTLRETMDKLKDKLGSAAIVLAAVDGGKVSLIAGVTADATGKVKAGELVNFVAQQVGGKGGGRPDMAQAGGTDPSQLPQALAGVQGWVAGKL